MGHLNKLITTVLNWGKIIYPSNRLRYFPPQFMLRDPVVQGVKKAWKQGYEVALVVIRFKDIHNIRLQYGPQKYEQFKNTLKLHIKQAVQKYVPKDETLVIHDYYYAGLSLFLKVRDEPYEMGQVVTVVENILTEVEKHIGQSYPNIPPEFEAGYMILEKQERSIQSIIHIAYQQALAMAEKKVTSDYNQMLFDITQIVEKREISLLAQPIVNMETKQVSAWEMLTRGPEGTPYESPLHLFSVARQTGHLYPLELIVLEKTIEQIENTSCNQDIFVNFTPISMSNKLFIEDIIKVVQRHQKISPKQFIFEITERDAIEHFDILLENISALRQLGFRIAVDDTGAGYASFNAIGTILPDIIKIDRSVIQDIDKDRVKESMLKGLMLVAKETGSLVVAEGIETEREVEVLSKNQVDFAQGYYFARPGKLKQMA